MSLYPIKVSKPTHLDGLTRSEVYEFFPQHRVLGAESKKSIVFLNRNKKETWKSDSQRDKIFQTVARAEAGSNLKARTVVEILQITEDACSYTYNDKGQLVRKTIVIPHDDALAAPAADVDPLLAAPAQPRLPVEQVPMLDSCYKVQELSLRQFKQIEFSHALIEGLKVAIDFLATPFAAFYRLVSGSESRAFAKMLNPVQHDRVGELTHDDVLSQVHFVGSFLASTDKARHGKGIDMEAVPEMQIYYNGKRRPCREKVDANGKSYYEIWIKETVINYHEPDGPKTKWKAVAKNSSETMYDGQVYTWRERFLHSRQGIRVVYEIQINGQWREVREDEIQRGTDRTTNSPDVSLKPNERSPRVESAVQKAAHLFQEGYAHGKKIHEARNSGSKKEKEAAVRHLSQHLDEIKTEKAMIIPVAQGEGRDYLPHFLVFVEVPPVMGRHAPNQDPEEIAPRRVLMKHICFSSTSVDKDKREAVTTYDVTNRLSTEQQRKKFFRALIAMHPYSRKKDAQEVTLKGPLNQDQSLEHLLLTVGNLQPSEEGPRLSRASRDPVKALFTVIHELNLQETHLSALEGKMPEISTSKAHFFKFYVDHLTTYYEENEGKLSADERARALDGILHYANKVRHYMEKELGVDAALAVTEHFMEFVEKKLEEMKRTEALEQKDVDNLQSKVKTFWATLSEPIDETLAMAQTTKSVEGSRILAEECTAVELLRTELGTIRLVAEERRKPLRRFNALMARAQGYLQRGEVIAAKTLLLDMMLALPPARPSNPAQDQTFWDMIPLEEIDQWNHALNQLAGAMFEASTRSGTYPLKPHEVFEFHVVIPLLQRYLFQRKIPFKVREFNTAWDAYKLQPELVAKLEKRRLEFIEMREEQIEQEETERLEAVWKADDKRESEEMAEYYRDLLGYRVASAAYVFQNDPGGWHRPTAPREPVREDAALKRARRERELEVAITNAKANDQFLRELNAIDTADMDWNALMACSDRTVAVMGCFARMVGISQDLLAYKIGGGGWIGKTFKNNNRTPDIWLMKQDRSIVAGSSPDFEKRYLACERTLAELSQDNDNGLAAAKSLIIGFEGKGDGTHITDEDEGRALDFEITRVQQGYFNPGEGGTGLVPEEIAACCKVIEMRKILSHPENHLQTHVSGFGASIRNLLGGDELTASVIKRKFAEMPAIRLVASKIGDAGCFTVSSTNRPGSLATRGSPEEIPTHRDRALFLGQASPEMCDQQVGGDHERTKYMESFDHRLFPHLDDAQDFSLRESALAKSLNPQDLSYLSISQCVHFIYQYPEKLSIPAVQHTLYKTLFQHGLIRELLVKNPQFFIVQGKVLNEICAFLQPNVDHLKSEIFLREVCERIRRHALDLQKTGELTAGTVSQISNALPAYNREFIAKTCLRMMETNEQKEYAQFALAFYCHQADDGALDEEAWTEALNAFYIMQKTTREMGHSGWQAELIYKVQTDILPKISKAIQGDQALRNRLLKSLSGREGQWQVVGGKEYTYALSDGTETFEVDLRTGKNFSAKIVLGERCKLPEQIRSHDHFRFLFKEWNPTVVSEPRENGIVDYYWRDETGLSEFKFRYNSATRSFQVFQTLRGQNYRFQKLSLSESKSTKFWQLFSRHNNSTVEDLVKNKGVWIPVDGSGKPDLSHVLLAQYESNLEKDPITLKLQGDKIVEATVGNGEEKMKICSGLAQKSGTLITCRDGNGLLLLSKDGTYVDEIRFPVDTGTQEQLILKKMNPKSASWVVSGREDWEWNLTDTKAYEARFGKNWRQYILPLKNRRTGEEEFWVFPHMIVGGEKKGSEVKFLRSAVDLIDAVGGKLSETGLVEGLDVEEIRMLAGAAENFAGGAANLVDAVQGGFGLFQGAVREAGGEPHEESDPQINQLLEAAKGIITPRAIRYRIEHRSESASHAGFFYLAFVASKRGDWATASRYMQLMGDCGHSNSPEDITQLQKMVLILLGPEAITGELGPEAITGEAKAFLTARSPMEAAFRAKLVARLIALNTSLKAQHGIDLLAATAIPHAEARALDLAKMIKIGGAHFYRQYRQGLSQHYQELAEHGLLLTQREEAILAEDTETFILAALASQEMNNLDPAAAPSAPAPFRFAIPDNDEIDAMVTVMSSLTNSNGVWSIHDMHKKLGSYPKWETLLAHFWDYWDWIYREENLAPEDIAFLLRDIPEGTKHADEIDTARRLLLTFWHYSKQPQHGGHRSSHDVATEVLATEIQKIRLGMTDMAEIQMKSDTLKREAAMSPTMPRVAYAWAYKGYAYLMQMYSELSYTDRVGGVPHERGSKHDFVQASKELLGNFLGRAMQASREAGMVITIDAIAPPIPYHPPRAIKPVDPREQHLNNAQVSMMMLLSSNRINLEDEHAKSLIQSLFDMSWDMAQDKFREMLVAGGASQYELNRAMPEFQRIHQGFANAVGLPENPYPKQIQGGRYEDAEVRLPARRPEWGVYFNDSCRSWNPQTRSWEAKESIWEQRAAEAKALYNPERFPAENVRARHALATKCAGIEAAKEELKGRTGSSFDVTKLKEVHREIALRLRGLRADAKKGHGAVLDFARTHGSELGIMHLFADRKRFTDGQIFDHVLDLYRYGQLGRLEDDELQAYFAELITETILVTTERQQYEKALATCHDLAIVLKGIVAGVPRSVDTETRKHMVQTLANRSVDWILRSTELKQFLEEGSNRFRYSTENAEGRHFLKDQAFTRRYLVSDYRNQWISRHKAISALEQMMNDLHTKKDEQGKPVRFIRAKMGTGKSDFVFPEAIDLLIQRGFQPIMITTDDLVPQLQVSMGHKAFVFKFDINFGLTDQAKPEEIDSHLKTLLNTLQSLKGEGKAVLTSPSQIGGLRDKRVHLQDELRKKNPGAERTLLFKQLQLVKHIEAYFKHEQARYLVDEDVNFDNSYEYNFATGDFRTVDTIRFDVAEHLVYLIQQRHPALWEKIVSNNLRSVQNVEEDFKGVARYMYRDIGFWTSVGWPEDVWGSIDENEFVDFVLGMRAELPRNMPAWNRALSEEKQQEKSHVAALKTFLSATLESVRGVNPRLERGISESNGVTVVPYSDGEEKKGILYGEESETILHHIFHYLGNGNKIGEEIFTEKEKSLGGLDIAISPHRPETWRDWAGRIAEVRNAKPYESKYEAFIHAPELAIQRFQFLRYLMLQTPEVRVYLEQITFNSQDLGIGTDIRVGSGTGQPFALNLADYTDDATQDADTVLGETLLCVNLKQPTTTFEGTPLEHIQARARDRHCHAVMNFDYDVLGNDCDRVAAMIRREGRQVIYRNKDLEKKIWSANQFFAMGYEPGAIDHGAFFYYARKDGRGVHFHIPRGGNHYGDAMVGTANKEDAIAQLLWRMRHLDMGHRVRLSHDAKTEAQIRKACGVQPGQPVTTGQAMLYFTLNAMQEEDVKNVKGVIFKAQTPAKTHLDAVVRAPFEDKDIDDTACLEELEGKVIFQATRGLYILSSRINWLREYQAQQKSAPVEFMQQLYADEAEKLLRTKADFEEGLRQVIAKQPQLRCDVNLLEWLDRQAKENAAFEIQLGELLAHLQRRLSPALCATTREVLRKAHAMRQAFENAYHEIQGEQHRIEDDRYQRFLCQNLPAEITVDSEGGARNEQRVQQLVEQERKQEQKKIERVVRPAHGDVSTRPLDFNHFKKVVLGQVTQPQSNKWFKFVQPPAHFKDNGNMSPLCSVLKTQLHAELPADLYQDTYISHRAWRMLYKMARNGAPVVEVMVAQVGAKCHTVIITPTEREEALANVLIEERRRAAPPHADPLHVAPPPAPPYTEDDAWNAAKAAFHGLAGGMVDIQTPLEAHKASVIPYLRTFLQQPSPEEAWQHIQLQIRPIMTAIGFGNFAGMVLGMVGNLENPLKAIFASYRAAQPQVVVAGADIDHVGVYALSNENFSYMTMDFGADRPQEDNPHFIHMMVLNKIYLNWDQFTLPEIDHLIKLVDGMDEKNFAHFLHQLGAAHASEMAETLRLIRQRADAGSPWILNLVHRKLDANYTVFTKEEEMALKAWIAKSRYIDISMMVNRLKSRGSHKSAEKIIGIQRAIDEERAVQ